MNRELLTFEISKDGSTVDIHGDSAGLNYLAQIITRVAKSGEHDHLMTESWGGNELSEEKQSENCTIINKVTIHCWPK